MFLSSFNIKVNFYFCHEKSNIYIYIYSIYTTVLICVIDLKTFKLKGFVFCKEGIAEYHVFHIAYVKYSSKDRYCRESLSLL